MALRDGLHLHFFGFVRADSTRGYIQVIEPDRLRYEGDLRSVRVKALPSSRGMISDRNGEH